MGTLYSISITDILTNESCFCQKVVFQNTKNMYYDKISLRDKMIIVVDKWLHSLMFDKKSWIDGYKENFALLHGVDIMLM